ncbi:MAG: DUF3857 domain-containing protein [Terriglobales bacterium]
MATAASALAVSCAAWAAAPALSSPSERLAAQELAFAQSATPVAKLVALYHIEDLGRLIAPAQLQATLNRLSATANLDPLLAAEIASQQAMADLRLGDGAAAAAVWRRMGVVGSWRAVGPFDNASPAAIMNAAGPETGPGLRQIDFNARYAGKQRPVGWRALPYTAPLGELELSAYLSPAQSASAYLVSWVRSAEAQPVALRLRDSGSTRLWVNGAEVFSEQSAHASDGFDQHAVGARLAAGWNQILAKVGDSETADWVFSLRVTTPEGKPLALEASDQAPAAFGPPPAAGPAPTVRDLTALAKAAGASAAGQLDYAWVLNRKHNFNRGGQDDANAFLAAIAAMPHNAEAVLDFAEHDSDQSRRYQQVQQLLQQPGATGAAWSARAYLDRGTIELGRNQYWRAREDFQTALGEPGGAGLTPAPAAAMARAPLAALGMLETFAGMGIRPQVLAWAQALREAGVQPAAIAAPTGLTLLRLGAVAEALSWLQTAHRADAGNLTLGLELADTQRRAGDLNGALATLRQTGELDGELPTLLEAQARALSGLGRGPEAQAAILRAIELAPDTPGLRIAQGEIARHFGHATAGLDAWQEALALNPQDASLRDRLRLARGGGSAVEASFERPYTQDLDHIIAAFKAASADAQAADENGPVTILADTTVINIFPSGNNGRYQQQILRINNRQGADSLAVFPVTYDPATEEVRFLSAHVVHADGSSADAPEAGDAPVSESVGYETFYNVRNKFVQMPAMREGDFVEIAYRVLPTTLESLYGDYFGDLQPFGGPAPTLFQQYVVIAPAGKTLYSKAIRFPGASAQHTASGETVYEWTARNLPAQVSEPAAPPAIEQSPYVAVSAFQTWNQFGQWYRQLIRDTFVMSDEMVQTVNGLVAGKTTEQAKVDAIYRWVIQNTHYVALEFGIHGYRPYPVIQVFHRRFGDCKDKASLLIAMLHQAGIRSEFVLVRVRELGVIDPSVPSVADFDHAIVYVPSLHRYLDGTAEFNGADELPEGDQRAFVLRIPVDADLGGGAAAAAPSVVETRARLDDGAGHGPSGSRDDGPKATLAPEVTAEQPASKNVSSRTLIGQLDASGDLHFQMNWIVTGGRAPGLRQALELPERRTGALQSILRDRLPGISVSDADVQNASDWDQPISISFRGVIPRFATVNGSMLLVPRQIVPTSWLPEMAALGTRRSNVLTGPPMIQVEEMHLALPPGYQLAGLPPASALDQPFATFQAGATMNGATLTLRSRLETKASLIPPEQYAAFRAFWAQVDQVLSRPLTARPANGGGQ